MKGQKLGTVRSFEYLGVVSDDGSKPKLLSKLRKPQQLLQSWSQFGEKTTETWIEDETGMLPCHSHISVFQLIVYHNFEEEEESMLKSFHFISGVIVPTEFQEYLSDNKSFLKCVFIITFSSNGYFREFEFCEIFEKC